MASLAMCWSCRLLGPGAKLLTMRAVCHCLINCASHYRVLLRCTIYTYVDNDGAMEICKALQASGTSRTYPDNADAITMIMIRPKVQSV
jgi:hypothetical protein